MDSKGLLRLPADAEELPSTEGASREGPARPEPTSDPKVSHVHSRAWGPVEVSLLLPQEVATCNCSLGTLSC